MSQQTRIDQAIHDLLSALDGDQGEPEAALAPLALVEAWLKEIPLEQLERLPCVEGTWLQALGRQAHGAHGARSARRAPTRGEQAGVTVSIRPQTDERLVLSPADGAVYELSRGQLTRIASSLAELVEREVAVAVGRRLGARLPRYGLDGEVWAVLVAGRCIRALPARGAPLRLEAAVRQAAERTGLPLGYVHMGTAPRPAPGVIGVVLAHASGRAAAPVDRRSLDPAAAATIPAELWSLLSAEHGIELDEERGAGFFLSPGGGGALMHEGGKDDGERSGRPLLFTWTDDPRPGCAVTLDTLPERFWLSAERQRLTRRRAPRGASFRSSGRRRARRRIASCSRGARR